MSIQYKLNFELVPDSCWYSNLRSILSPKEWDAVRFDAYARAQGRCMICNRSVRRLEAHERWSFDKEKQVQKLEDVVAVCHACHSVIHIGRTQIMGYENSAIAHFKKVNNCDYQGYISELKRANEKCIELSTVGEWSLDLTWLERYIKE